MSAFERVVVAQVPCLAVLCDVLADDLATLSALARTSRVAARQLRLDVFFERALRLRFSGHGGVRWAAGTPWRRVLASAINAMRLSDVPATRSDVPPFSESENAHGARGILQSAPFALICSDAALLRRWAERVGHFVQTFYGADAESLFDDPRFELDGDLFFAVLSISGLLAPLLPLDCVQFHDFVANCTSPHGVNLWLIANIGPSRAKLVDSATCSLAAFSTINCAVQPFLPTLPVWPEAAGVFALTPELQRFAARPSPLEIVQLLTEAWETGLLSMYFYQTLDTDPGGQGRFTFAPFDRELFVHRVTSVTGVWRKSRVAMLQQHLPAHDELIAVGGHCIDEVGHGHYIGFLDLTTRGVVLLKSYQDGDESDGSPCWVYVGKLYSFGFGGRWSQTGFVENHSGPFLLLPNTPATATMLDRLSPIGA